VKGQDEDFLFDMMEGRNSVVDPHLFHLGIHQPCFKQFFDYLLRISLIDFSPSYTAALVEDAPDNCRGITRREPRRPQF
jgi:hypothetical protein